ncbi:unnamed protein product [Cylindrotheca closterium]|uniref:NAD(P)-binding domain-containing protein n=1 Tax=Cylindrotheca closterium TaxID=2856 RepID=A0AAD2FEE6_9STRA|nr:unnamed protein product [Cylindrotheca closterium]
MYPTKVLVVGATGATGKHVVQMMLDQGHAVIALVRSKESMLSKLNDKTKNIDRLEISEGSITQMKHEQLVELTKDCDYVVSCLGHNMTFKGMFVKDRRLVADACKKLTKAMPASCKFLLMGSDGVAHKGVDPKRKLGERAIIFMLRYLIPPHADNEKAAAYLLGPDGKKLDWVIVRPTNLVDAEEASGKYTISEKAEVSLFGDTSISRNDVAHFFVELMTKEETYSKYQHKMPVVVGIPEEQSPKADSEPTETEGAESEATEAEDNLRRELLLDAEAESEPTETEDTESEPTETEEAESEATEPEDNLRRELLLDAEAESEPTETEDTESEPTETEEAESETTEAEDNLRRELLLDAEADSDPTETEEPTETDDRFRIPRRLAASAPERK